MLLDLTIVVVMFDCGVDDVAAVVNDDVYATVVICDVVIWIVSDYV